MTTLLTHFVFHFTRTYVDDGQIETQILPGPFQMYCKSFPFFLLISIHTLYKYIMWACLWYYPVQIIYLHNYKFVKHITLNWVCSHFLAYFLGKANISVMFKITTKICKKNFNILILNILPAWSKDIHIFLFIITCFGADVLD